MGFEGFAESIDLAFAEMGDGGDVEDEIFHELTPGGVDC